MPYIKKDDLYKLEKRTFMNALIHFSGALSHLKMDATAELLWQLYKGELTQKEFDGKMAILEREAL